MLSCTLAVIGFISCLSIVENETGIEIALGDVWALNMPGTRSISELEKGAVGAGSLMAEIGEQHSSRKRKAKAGPAFVVEGTAIEALKAANKVITGKEPRRPSVCRGSDITLIFFSLEFGYYVHLTKIERDGKAIRVEYEFVPHYSENRTQHFAMIPLGKLPSGQFNVEIIAGPFQRRNVSRNYKEISDDIKLPLVSSSFKFAVQE